MFVGNLKKLQRFCLYLQQQYNIQNMTSALEVVKDLFCGVLSGWGQVVSMIPFENIKIKMISKPQEYNQGYIHAVKKTIAQEGALGLYKGMLFPLIGVGAQVSVQFGVVESLKKMMKKTFADNHGKLPSHFSFICGFISGLPSAIIVSPLDHARFKVTLNKQKGQGSVGMALRILREHGLRKLYIGFWPTLYRETMGLGCYFFTYDYLIRNFIGPDGKVNLWGSMFCGGCAGASFWAFTYPVDYVKTMVQSDSLEKPKFKGNIDCAKVQMKKGFPVFFTALPIMIVRAVVANAVGFVCFQVGKKMLY